MVVLALLAGCVTKSVVRPSCTNHVLHESVAPGGNAKAVIFERDCTTGATIQISLVPADARAKLGISDGLVRLSVGIEDVADLIADLENGLA